MNRTTELSVFSRSIQLMVAMFVIVSTTFLYYVYTEKQIDRANELRQRSFSLADELRQSSDDLTRFVRTYVLTGNPLYKQHYQEIIDIRDGKTPRPLNYNNIYWDLVLANDNRPQPNGQAVALLDLMRQANFSEAEFAKLAQAKANSDALTATELAAMALIDSANPLTEAIKLKASNMLHDTAYHNAKASIMGPISEIYESVDTRTSGAVEHAKLLALLVRMLLIFLGFLLIITIWRIHRVLSDTLGCSVNELHTHIVQIGRGDLTHPMSVAQGMENSVLGWLAETQNNLARITDEREGYKAYLQQRTTDLALALDAAEAANRAKSVFLANMSHELRTPMNAIMGMTERVLSRSSDPMQIDQLNKVKIASELLLHIINDILDISKIEAEQMDLEYVDFRLGEVMEDIFSLLDQKAMDKGLKFLIQMPSELSQRRFNGDPMRLKQILLNLTSNALKFTEQGEIIVRANLAEENPDDALLRVEVTDTGIGIDAKTQRRLFNAFEQGDSSMTRKYGGTGLGLVISQRLARMMGGEIGVESTFGQGSTFWFTLRLGNACEATAPESTMPQDSAEMRLKTQFAGRRVLLAEDEPINRDILRFLLENVGLEVDVAENGQQALELARQSLYTIILMDMQMPVLNGVDAAKAIRDDSRNLDAPILAITANAFAEDRQVCLDAGMNDHIGKPVERHALYEILLKWLAKSHP